MNIICQCVCDGLFLHMQAKAAGTALRSQIVKGEASSELDVCGGPFTLYHEPSEVAGVPSCSVYLPMFCTLPFSSVHEQIVTLEYSEQEV